MIRIIASLCLAFGLVSCNRTTDCRPSTIYLELELNAETVAADSLWVTLDIPNRASITKTFKHPAGEARGSVEFVFTEASYPKQQMIGVTVEARKAEVVLGRKSQSFTTDTGCAWLELSFDEITTGSSDALPSPDASPSPGDALVTPPSGSELCFNGLDDDNNGKIDCADPACGPAVATCLPELPGGIMGVTVAASEECPMGFRAQPDLVLGSTIAAPSTCEGCRCSAAAPTCRATLFLYTEDNLCADDTQNIGGNVPIQLSSTTKCFETASAKRFYGGRMTTPAVQDPGSCMPSGSPMPTPAAFVNPEKFCKAEQQGGGCAANQLCVPTVAQKACTVVEQGQCPANLTGRTRYREISDRRRCGTCSCGAPSGGECKLETTVYGMGCGMQNASNTVLTLNSSFRQCGVNFPGSTALGVGVRDLSRPGACTASASVTGEAAPEKPVQLCCTGP